jgi:hypothetical protein
MHPWRTIDVLGFGFSQLESFSYTQGNNGTGTLSMADGLQHASLTFAGSYSQNSFVLSNDGSGGTLIKLT